MDSGCSRIKEYLQGYLAHTLTSDEENDVEVHLAYCNKCREFLHELMRRQDGEIKESADAAVSQPVVQKQVASADSADTNHSDSAEPLRPQPLKQPSRSASAANAETGIKADKSPVKNNNSAIAPQRVIPQPVPELAAKRQKEIALKERLDSIPDHRPVDYKRIFMYPAVCGAVLMVVFAGIWFLYLKPKALAEALAQKQKEEARLKKDEEEQNALNARRKREKSIKDKKQSENIQSKALNKPKEVKLSVPEYKPLDLSFLKDNKNSSVTGEQYEYEQSKPVYVTHDNNAQRKRKFESDDFHRSERIPAVSEEKNENTIKIENYHIVEPVPEEDDPIDLSAEEATILDQARARALAGEGESEVILNVDDVSFVKFSEPEPEPLSPQRKLIYISARDPNRTFAFIRDKMHSRPLSVMAVDDSELPYIMTVYSSGSSMLDFFNELNREFPGHVSCSFLPDSFLQEEESVLFYIKVSQV